MGIKICDFWDPGSPVASPYIGEPQGRFELGKDRVDGRKGSLPSRSAWGFYSEAGVYIEGDFRGVILCLYLGDGRGDFSNDSEAGIRKCHKLNSSKESLLIKGELSENPIEVRAIEHRRWFLRSKNGGQVPLISHMVVTITEETLMFKHKWALLPLFCLMLLGSCSSSKKVEKGIVHFNLGDEPHTLDPRRARDPNSQMLMRMCFDGLTRIGPHDETQLAVASNVEISEDLKTYVFTLRKSHWSNGDLVKASDFVYAWRSLLNPDFPGDNAYQLYMIKNAKAFKEGKCSEEELGIHSPEEQLLIVELEYPTPYFLELLASPFFFPIHQKIDQVEPRWAERQETYVSNGPFSLKSWHHHDQISVRKNPSYWDAGQVHLEGIDLFMVENKTALHLFDKGEIHWTGSPVGSIPVDAIAHLRENKTVYSKPRAETAFLRSNVEVRALRNPKVRRALALAIDRKGIVEHVLQAGQPPAMSLIPPSMQLTETPYFEDNAPEKANLVLEEALEESRLEKSELGELTLTYINSERSHLIAQAIQEQWHRAFGFQVRLEAIERKVYFDRISRKDYQLAFCSWGADFHDPINFLEVFKYRHQGTNNTQWENEQYIELLNASSQIHDRKKRLETLRQCEAILMEEMPIIPLFYYSMLYLRDENLDGVVLTSLGNLDFKWASLQNEGK